MASGVSSARRPVQIHQRGDCWQRGQRTVPLRTTLRAMVVRSIGRERAGRAKLKGVKLRVRGRVVLGGTGAGVVASTRAS